MLTGPNGLITQANEAKAKTEIATVEEQRQLAMAEAATNLENTTYQGITIPAGFAPTRIDGENTVKEGLVIIDSDGNEFVWVPCENDNYKKYDYEANKGKRWPSYDYNEYTDWKDDEIDEEENKKSVEENKGFYIARYEAGVPSNAKFYVGASTEGTKTYQESKNDVGSNLKPLSKKGVQAWNLISQTNALQVSERMYSGETYGVRSQLIDGTAWDTALTWILKDSNYSDIEKDSTTHGNYKDNNKEGTRIKENNCLFAEHLYNSTSKAWCLGKKYQYGLFTSGYTASYKVPEGEKTNYNNYDSGEEYTYDYYVEMATGASDNTKLKNIYDMAGNMAEWTTEYGYHGSEADGGKYAILRGGSFSNEGNHDTVVTRRGTEMVTRIDSPGIGFRVVLYIK